MLKPCQEENYKLARNYVAAVKFCKVTWYC